MISPEQLEQVNARVMQLLGPFDVLCVCVHAEHDGCGCRKPAPGLVHAAAAQLGVPVHRCVVIGDIGADVTAATPRSNSTTKGALPSPASNAVQPITAAIRSPARRPR